jgi:hypothetical protein
MGERVREEISEMTHKDHRLEEGCGCGCDRRDFLAAVGATLGGLVFASLKAQGGESAAAPPKTEKAGATVRVAFLYPPSKTFAGPDGWWSWPGNDFDAEARQKQYLDALREMEKKLGLKIIADGRPIADNKDAARLAQEIRDARPDGLLLIMFYNRSLSQADLLLAAADKVGIPTVFFIGLGVKHGSVEGYCRRPGVYFIQSLDNLDAIEAGLRMINARRIMSQTRLLSINEAKEPSEGREAFFGIAVRVIPFARYAEEFGKAAIGEDARAFIARFTGGAREQRGITPEALENAARAHLALKTLLADEQADGLTMNCLRRGMLKPCMSFAALNSQLIPAACENDLAAAYTQLLGQLLTGRPGFQHNPCYDTERNQYYASHCTCATKMYGPDGPDLPYLLRRFAHTNEGSCAIQVFWKQGDPVTMLRYYPGKEPALDVYAGKVAGSHAMPPAGGCTTNVAIEIADRPDACTVRGHHNLVFCGDFARRFRLFAQLHKMRLAETGFKYPEAVDPV